VPQTATFTCVIEDKNSKDKYSAQVEMRKKQPVPTSLQNGKIDLADAFITPISGHDAKKVHNHFVVYDLEGNGLYIVRDPNGKEVRRRKCSTWELGNAFGAKVRDVLKKWC
jgi:hypothetical protein